MYVFNHMVDETPYIQKEKEIRDRVPFLFILREKYKWYYERSCLSC